MLSRNVSARPDAPERAWSDAAAMCPLSKPERAKEESCDRNRFATPRSSSNEQCLRSALLLLPDTLLLLLVSLSSTQAGLRVRWSTHTVKPSSPLPPL